MLLQRFGVEAQTLQKYVTDNTIYSFGLTIGLQVIRYGHVQSGAKHLEDSLPKLPSKSVLYNCQRQTVLTKHAVDNRVAVPSPSMASGTAAK